MIELSTNLVREGLAQIEIILVRADAERRKSAFTFFWDTMLFKEALEVRGERDLAMRDSNLSIIAGVADEQVVPHVTSLILSSVRHTIACDGVSVDGIRSF